MDPSSLWSSLDGLIDFTIMGTDVTSHCRHDYLCHDTPVYFVPGAIIDDDGTVDVASACCVDTAVPYAFIGVDAKRRRA
jgi:hypothetical protein